MAEQTPQANSTPAQPQSQATSPPTVVVTERRGSGAGWLVALIVLLGVIVAVWAVTRPGSSDMVKDVAVTNAADRVGQAADKVGDAAGRVGTAADNAASNAAGTASSAAESSGDAQQPAGDAPQN